MYDLQTVVAHRFRRQFDNFQVRLEDFVANQLRMGRENFTQGVWTDALDRIG
jgi:hypothetical protein